MKGILVVSFGTSYKETRELTIKAIEKDIEKSFPDYKIYTAWTSKMIIRKVLRVEGVKIPTVEEAMEEILRDGITELVVQPTHIINGIENDIMTHTIESYKDKFKFIKFSTPLLTSQEDMNEAVGIVSTIFKDVNEDTAVVLMGHGSEHYANMAYSAFDYTMKEKGMANFFMGTVEAYPSIEEVKNAVKNGGYKKVILTPFMIVAGDHATNDLIGDEEDSWYSEFKGMGMEVSYVLKGLGQYEGIRNIFINHLKKAIGEI